MMSLSEVAHESISLRMRMTRERASWREIDSAVAELAARHGYTFAQVNQLAERIGAVACG